MLKRLFFASLIFTHYASQAQSACSGAVQTASNNCASALQSAAAAGSGGLPNGSLNGASSALAAAAVAGSGNLAAATDYCQNQIKQCQSSCGPGSSSSGTPTSPSSGGCVGANCDANGNPTGPIVPCTDSSKNCSPLVIQIGQQPLQMTSPQAGVWFDILGERASPVAHTPTHISWLAPSSLQGNYFLTLPNQSAKVLGIDQLFGNNTFGPDSERPFADNGFEALKKFDGRLNDGTYDATLRNGFIDQNDPVFEDLRLWQDLNGNGVAEANELFTLKSLGVSAIDLNYDPNFLETDMYGNQIRTKSVVRLDSGALRLIFDLWFVAQP